jgi:hypothetical protein
VGFYRKNREKLAHYEKNGKFEPVFFIFLEKNE